MPRIKRPSARLLALAAELKRLREAAHLTVLEASERLGVSQPTFSRIESARTTVSVATVEKLLDIYGSPSQKRAELIQLAKESGRRGWWRNFNDLWQSGFVALENDASEILVFELALVPGLLQTDGYHRGILDATKDDGISPDTVERLIQARATRQTILTRPGGPALHCVLSESVLARQVGGQAVMRAQILALWEASQRPNVTVQILPFSHGAHASMDGSFHLLKFHDLDLEIGYVEIPCGHVYLESAEDLKGINVRWASLVKDALSPSESEAMLQRYL